MLSNGDKVSGLIFALYCFFFLIFNTHLLAPRAICSHPPSLHPHPSATVSSLCHSVTGSRFSGKDDITLVTVFNQMSLSFHAPLLSHASCRVCVCVIVWFFLFIYLFISVCDRRQKCKIQCRHEDEMRSRGATVGVG